ncbi:MAG: glycosyltransferase family 39 protein [Anaerolineae bacterium]|jgi:4-amino-4-deoxy-L-arabinose transferase-like glycosyltransferase|nr:glycosyltransferase family 39 protein [Anaerolineae bacterium]
MRFFRVILAYGFTLLAFVIAIGAMIPLNQRGNPAGFVTSIALLLLVVFAVWLSLYFLPEGSQFPVTRVDEAPLNLSHRLAIGIGVGMLLLLTELNADFIGLRPVVGWEEHGQLGLLVFGGLLMTWGFSGGWRILGPPSPAQQTEIVLLFLLTLLALWLRWIDVEQTIPFFVDEVSFTNTIPIYQFRDPSMLMQPINSVAAFPRMYPYLQWLSVEIFGQNLAAIRVITGLLGALTVPALYFLGKQLFTPTVAWIAAGWIATMPLHLHFSRTGLNNIGDPLMGVLAFAFFVRGLRYGGRANFAFAGLALGWTQLFHEAGRLSFPPIFIAWCGLCLILWWRKDLWILRRIAQTLAIAGMVALPFYVMLLSNLNSIAPRVRDVGLQAMGSFDQYFLDTLRRLIAILQRILFRSGEVIYYPNTMPYLLFFITLFLVIGLAVLIWRFWQPRALLLLLWIAIPLAGITLFLSEIQSPRMLPFVPPIILIAAFGMEWTARRLFAPRPSLYGLVMGLAIPFLCAYQATSYFSNHVTEYRHQIYLDTTWQQIVPAFYGLPPNSNVIIISDYRIDRGYASSVVRFLTGERIREATVYTTDLFQAPQMEALSRAINQVIYLEMPNGSLYETLLSLYPEAIVTPLPAQPGQTIWYLEILILALDAEG